LHQSASVSVYDAQAMKILTSCILVCLLSACSDSSEGDGSSESDGSSEGDGSSEKCPAEGVDGGLTVDRNGRPVTVQVTRRGCPLTIRYQIN
jgi:hypothetical protein